MQRSKKLFIGVRHDCRKYLIDVKGKDRKIMLLEERSKGRRISSEVT
jgi:hypothetical protein